MLLLFFKNKFVNFSNVLLKLCSHSVSLYLCKLCPEDPVLLMSSFPLCLCKCALRQMTWSYSYPSCWFGIKF